MPNRWCWACRDNGVRTLIEKGTLCDACRAIPRSQRPVLPEDERPRLRNKTSVGWVRPNPFCRKCKEKGILKRAERGSTCDEHRTGRRSPSPRTTADGTPRGPSMSEQRETQEAVAELAAEGITNPGKTLIANVRHRNAERKRDIILEMVKGGASQKEAYTTAGFTVAAYDWNKKKHQDWSNQVDYWIRQNFRKKPKDVSISFGDYVKWWFPDRRDHLPHQLRIAKALDDIGPREIKMFLIWPEAGKTATLEDYICMTLARDPGHRFRYVSEAQDLAKRVVGTVQRRMTDPLYEPWQKEFGPFYEKNQERNGRPWSQDQFSMFKNESGERDRNLVASSWTSAVYGSRIDTLVLDDLQSQRNYVQAEEIFRRIRGTFFNRGIEMRTLIIGTRIGPGDVYERFLDAGLVHNPIILPAEDPMTGEPTEPMFWERDLVHDGKACCAGFRTCPRDRTKLTPKEFMELIRFQTGKDIWASAYQQNPTQDDRSTFAEFLERCFDHDRRYGRLAS